MSQPTELLDGITERELEIIAGIAENLTNREIAERLYLSQSTVKWYIRQLNQKLHTTTRHEILAHADEFGLLDQDNPQPTKQLHNLPYQATPFIGREQELDEIHEILERVDVRLLTILAPGGMGKTRLALEAAEQQLNNFEHGVYLIELQSLTDIANILSHVATSIDYQLMSDRREPKQQLLDYLKNKQILLVLDNFEHVLDGVSLFHEILQTAPAVKLLVTSREKLNLSSETIYRLYGMSFAVNETTETIREYDAVQLLEQSAKRLEPTWAITAENQNAVEHLCQLTGGMPLGILLATAWLDVYSIDRICDEIDKSIDILESNLRDVPDRHRSIQKVFEHSWNRLLPAEQQIFTKLSVFRGGCTLSAIEYVTNANPKILQKLVNKALLMCNRSGRYSMHELLRQYGEQHLNESAGMIKARDTHLKYYATEVHKLKQEFEGANLIEAANSIQIDFENIRTAWYWALESGQYNDLTQMIRSIGEFVILRCRFQDGEVMFSDAFRHLESCDDAPLVLIAKLQCQLGALYSMWAKWDKAKPFLSSSLSLARDLKDLETEGLCCYWLSGAIKDEDQLEYVITLIKRGMSIFAQLGNTAHIAWGYIFWANFLSNIMGDSVQAVKYYDDALRLFKEINNKWGLAYAYMNLAYSSSETGHYDEGEQQINEAIKLFREIGKKDGLGGALLKHAELARLTGNYEPAKASFLETLTIFQDLGSRWVHQVLADLAELELDFGRVNTARQYAQNCLTAARQTEYPEDICYSLTILSDVETAQHNYHEAHDYILQAQEYAIESNSTWHIMTAHRYLFWTFFAIHEYDQARHHLLIAMKYDREVDNICHKLDDVAGCACLLAHQDEIIRAVELFGLVFEHSVKNFWIEQHPLPKQLRRELSAQLGEHTYASAWERGTHLDLDRVMQNLYQEQYEASLA